MTEKNLHIRHIHVLWVPFPMEIDEPFHPIQICLLRPIGKTGITYMLAQLIEKTDRYCWNTGSDIVHEHLPITGIRISIGITRKFVNDLIQPSLALYLFKCAVAIDFYLNPIMIGVMKS